MNSVRETHAISYARGLLLCLFIAASLCLFVTQPAFAEVRRSDIVRGVSVEEAGLIAMQCPSIEAEHAILVDSNGNVYFMRNATSPAQIASITKVMTAIVALDYAGLDMHVAVSANAASVGESSAGLQEGDVMDMETALKALLVPSGNDAGVAIAEAVGARMLAEDPNAGNDAQNAFVNAMNRKAAEIGCVDTVYENPHGLDDEEFAGNLHSTAADQAKVAQCAMTYEVIRSIVGGGSTTIQVNRGGSTAEIELTSTDTLLETYKYTIGIKTGVTDLAGPSFMGAANNGTIELYSVVLDSPDEWQRFEDTKSLFNWAFEHYLEIPLTQTTEKASMKDGNGNAIDVPVVGEAPLLDWTNKTVRVTFADANPKVTVFDLDGNVSQSIVYDDLHGGVYAGQKVGVATYKQRNNVVASIDLVACEDVEGPNVIDSLGVWWDRLVGGFNGTPEHAEAQVYNVMPVILNKVSNAA